MGKEAEVRAVFADGDDFGRLQYEPPRLIFRGARRRVFQGDDLAGVRAEAALARSPAGSASLMVAM